MFASGYGSGLNSVVVFPDFDDCVALQCACIGICGRHWCLLICEGVACHGARWGHFRGVKPSQQPWKNGKNDRNARGDYRTRQEHLAMQCNEWTVAECKVWRIKYIYKLQAAINEAEKKRSLKVLMVPFMHPAPKRPKHQQFIG